MSSTLRFTIIFVTFSLWNTHPYKVCTLFITFVDKWKTLIRVTF